MARWLWMTGGLVVWAAQFSGLYALSSLADVVAEADAPVWRMAGLALTVASALVCGGLLWLAVQRRRRQGGFRHDIAALSAGVGGLAVIWQGLPTVIGY